LKSTNARLVSPIGIATINAASGDSIFYAMQDMGDLTLIWDWNLTGATSKSYARIKLTSAPELEHYFLSCSMSGRRA
jgi:hypothetical protein